MMEWYWIYLAVGVVLFMAAIATDVLTVSGSIASQVASSLAFIALWPAFLGLYVEDSIDYWRKSKGKRR